ncbi:MAG: tRNA (N6-threonylcarbamoyladenosine(37)-N6)-methyltransferase TrmO [Desulfitobacteriaceae bacterium]
MEIKLEPIGRIYTPYFNENTPHQPVPDAPGEFWIEVNSDYADGLKDLEKYRYIYVLFHFDKAKGNMKMTVSPPWASGAEVGLFASRSPNRPNPIGLSIVEIKEISGNEISISGIDVYNGTPLLDIKPYIHSIDAKTDANDGWLDELEDKGHLLAHMFGRPHEHDQSHSHAQEHGHHVQDGREYPHENHGHEHAHEHHEHEHHAHHQHGHHASRNHVHKQED